MEKAYIIICFILMLPGALGVLIPVIPGIPYMFAVTLVYSFLTKFQTLNSNEIIFLGIIAGVSILVDYATGILGAKYGGAAKKSLLWGLIGSIVGTIVLPPFGGIAGLFLGVLAAEVLTHHDQKKALRAASGGVIGSLAGIIINLILAIIFLVYFLIFALN